MIKNHHISRARFNIVLATLMLAASLVLPAFSSQTVSAAQITNRKLTLMAGATDGGSLPGGVVNHRFNFDLPGGTDIGSIKFQYCTTAAAVPGGIDCNVPTGLSVTGAGTGGESGATGFVNISSNNATGEIVLSRVAASPAAGSVEYTLTGITNPTNTNETFFVRITTHAALDGSGAIVDSGTVAASTANAIELDGTMPESLVFCTGATISTNSGAVPDCSTATSGNISFDRLFSPTDTAIASSQMAASTNAGQGYAITVNGTTLTSGSNTIAAMASTTSSIQGTPQFGLNLVENLTTADVAFGAEVTQTGGALYTGTPTTDYDTAESFKYLNGDTVASSTGGSDAQIFTVAYIANVPGSQPAGTYSTTLTYICTPTF